MKVAAISGDEQVNFERTASDSAVPARTVREFYQVLKDTLIGELLPVFVPRHPTRKPASRAKFFFFDVGVANALIGTTELIAATAAHGRALEELVFCELRAFLSYRLDDRPLAYWRTSAGNEVDFVVGDEVAIEAKASGRISDGDLRGLRRLAEETPLRRQIVVCTEEAPRRAHHYLSRVSNVALHSGNSNSILHALSDALPRLSRSRLITDSVPCGLIRASAYSVSAETTKLRANGFVPWLAPDVTPSSAGARARRSRSSARRRERLRARCGRPRP